MRRVPGWALIAPENGSTAQTASTWPLARALAMFGNGTAT
jgi:hypothetical protein